MKIDIYCHVCPERYRDALFEHAPQGAQARRLMESTRTLWDLETRFRTERLLISFEDSHQPLKGQKLFNMIDCFGHIRN